MIIFMLLVGVLSWLLAAVAFLAAILGKGTSIQEVAAGVYGTMGTVAFLGASILNWLRKIGAPRYTDEDSKNGKAKQCYQCAELVHMGAQRCRYCGEQFHRIDKQQAA